MPVHIKNKSPVVPPVDTDEAPRGNAKVHRVNMVLPEALSTQLRAMATQTGLSVPMLLRFAAAEYLAK
jgi:16S rRNA U516 pseudouridylate synthase RsuA-like enzyme